jgi:hypothetical protein
MPDAPPLDPYLILEIARNATPAQIRAAYLNLVSRYHPDRHEGNPLADLASEKLAEVNRAYEMLSDPERRAAWDEGHVDIGVRPGAGPRPIIGKVILTVLGLVIAVRFGAPILRGLFGLLREGVAAIQGTPLAVVPVLLLLILVVLTLRRSRRRPGVTAAPPVDGPSPRSRD